MINIYDIAYSAAVAFSAPFWMARSASRRKVLSALGQRMGHVLPREGPGHAVLIHAVSLGEINATRDLVAQLKEQRPELHIVISTTTVTGYDRGRQLYGGKPGLTLVRFPLDFSVAINTLLNAIDPSLVVLMEGEIWPNFLLHCQRRKIPVVLVNGRMTESAFRRYRRIRFITAAMLRRIKVICAQEIVYADRFKALGAESVTVTGTMKFDTAQLADSVPGDRQMGDELGLAAGEPIWVCGSTGPGEEQLLLDAYRTLQKKFPTLRLVIIPRKPERFDEVAELIQSAGFPLRRRSARTSTGASDQSKFLNSPGRKAGDRLAKRDAGRSIPGLPAGAITETHFSENVPPVILGDTMGELRKFYSLATVVFVGRSLVDLGSSQWGSDMIEPAALAKPVAIGPWTQNFAEAVRSFKAADAMVEVNSVPSLVETIGCWLEDPYAAADIGCRAQAVVRENRGATARHVEVILKLLDFPLSDN